MRGRRELVRPARRDEYGDAGVGGERDTGGRVADGKARRRHPDPIRRAQRLVELLPQRARILGSRRDLTLELLAGEFLQRRGDAALTFRRQRSRRLQFREHELGLTRALARLREERIVAEARNTEPGEHHREEEQGEPLPQATLAIEK